MGLIQESKIFEKVLKANGFEPYGVICKVGAKDKSVLGVREEDKVRPGQHESACNPIMQAKLLNRENTDLNVICGLCVGHDSMFIKYSDAPVTYLVVKDRVLAHNPVGALYTNGLIIREFFRESVSGRRIKNVRSIIRNEYPFNLLISIGMASPAVLLKGQP